LDCIDLHQDRDRRRRIWLAEKNWLFKNILLHGFILLP
jgi:hypothetical protein